MPKSYRIRTQVGIDKQVNIDLNQDFEFLEILSLKLAQSELYIRQCSDYGVVVGRVSINNGFGVPNAKLSIFIPITQEDELNPVLNSIYPYKTVDDINEDGYKYNLLPYKPSYPGHSATGSFPDLEDVLINPTAIEIYDKYYKFTVTTNDSGDFMIFGVPVGSQTLVMNVDLSDIGPFSLSPQDLIRLGIATDSQVNGTKFKTSENLNILPQIITVSKDIIVEPLWGDEELCQVSISRTDFDLTNELNLEIKPTAIFMGSIFSDSDRGAIRKKCKPPLRAGNMCSLIAGPGQIQTIRQTIRQDNFGRPILEVHELENNGNVIDENGTWLLDVPMNLDYITTNEFGEQVFSNDERQGIPTKAKYRFKIKWNQTPDLSAPIKRGSFLVPNVREHGWTSSNNEDDPINNTFTSPSYQLLKSSYAFSLDWNDYGYSGLTTQGEKMIEDAIDCTDMFYEMSYNKVYTISQLITRYTKGSLNRRFSGIKNITDDECESENYKFPANDAQFKPDLLFIAFTILMTFLVIIVKVVVRIFHIIARLLEIILNFLDTINSNLINLDGPIRRIKSILDTITNIGLPLYTFPDCELCSCKDTTNPSVSAGLTPLSEQNAFVNNSILSDVIDAQSYNYNNTDPNNDFTGVIQQVFAGSERNNLVNSFGFRATLPIVFDYSIGDTTEQYFFGTLSLPVHERINLLNTRAKFFGSGLDLSLIDTNNESVLNQMTFSQTYYLGGGVNQIKVSFNSELNPPIETPDLELNNISGLYEQTDNLTTPSENRNYHYDNVVIILTEEKFDKGRLLTFENPTTFNDPNLTGQTINAYGTYSITGTPINTGTTTIYVSHTHPFTGVRLRTKYDIQQTSDDQDKFLRYPTDIEYFQVVESIPYSQFGNPDPEMGQFSIRRRVFEPFSQIYSIRFSDANTNWNWGGGNAWESYQNKNSTYITILMRGVDPHSTPQPMKIGLGRIFGKNNHWDYSVEGDFKLNIPLQPNDTLDFGQSGTPQTNQDATDKALRCTRHSGNIFPNNDPVNSDNLYTGGRLFYNSYHFIPSVTDWVPFSSNSVRNYISTSEFDNQLPAVPLGTPDTGSLATLMSSYSFVPTDNGRGLRSGANNYYGRRGVPPDLLSPSDQSVGAAKYIPDECVEGTSFMMLLGQELDCNISVPFGEGNCRYSKLVPIYYSKKYLDVSPLLSPFSMTNNERIVMRSDRLPTSDSYQQFSTNTMGLMANGQFAIYEIEDQGIVNIGFTASTTSFVINEIEPIIPGEDAPNSIAEILNSFSCGSLVPIECYTPDPPDGLQIGPSPQCLETTYERNNGDSFTTQYFIQGSCYSLVRPPYNQRDNVRNDLDLVNEWYSRMNINFGACREVFSHLFINNWVNGSLYMFPFKNSRFFTSPNSNPPNQPYNKFCTDNVYMHPETFNIYYRSAPYKDNGDIFIGRDGTGNGNNKNHMYPTTIMDLGPRDELQKYLSQSGNWDGYIMNKLESTTFGDTSDLLNIFVLSRLANTSFTTFFKSRSSSVLNFFDSRSKKFVDGDFAQMLATNSQFGIAAYEPESYPEPLSSDTLSNSSLFLPTTFGNDKDVIFGIFYTGDSQSRDYISPNRILYNPNGQIGDPCAYSFIPVTTQVVPFYLWEIKQNTDITNIFGTQTNDWTFENGYSYRYQGLDRLLLYEDTRIFQPSDNISNMNFHKGWIYNVDDTIINSGTGENDYNPYQEFARGYNFGAPYYFYFGLKKGASAFDRFTTKWIDTDELVE